MLCHSLLINIAHGEASVSLQVWLFDLAAWQTYGFVFYAFITSSWALGQSRSPLGKSAGLLKGLLESGLLHSIASLPESAGLEDFKMA
jgi:hypothetical protein